jgi:transposase
LVASAEQVSALRVLAGSPVRGEADRARAVLLTLAGWTALEIGEAFGVGEDSVRRWRAWFAQGASMRWARPWPRVPRPSGASGRWPVREILAAPVQDRPNWILPRLRAEIEARTGVRLAQSHLSVLLRKGGSDGGGPATA